jgi:hypothetical protein
MPYSMQRTTSSADGIVTSTNLSTNAFIHAASLEGRTHDKFWNRMQEKASLGVSLLETHKSLQMISRRLRDLTGLVKAIRRLDVRKINRILGVSQRGKTRIDDSKTFANLWLEYTFGWTPMIQDVYSACQVLSQNFGFFKHKVRTYDLYPQVQAWDGGSSYSTISDCYYTCGATVRVTNPNVNLANQLGLLNPAYVLWDAVPFSFVIDWFAPVGKLLRRLSNGVGLEITKAWKQASASTRGYGTYTTDGINRLSSTYTGVATSRAVGLPTPPNFLRSIKLPQLDPWLAATSLSLFVQQFKFGR